MIDRIKELKDLNLIACCALECLTTAQKDRFSSVEIAVFLVEKAHFDISRQAVDYALNAKKSRGFCNKNNRGWKLMVKGREELSKAIGKKKIQLIAADHPFSAQNSLKEILGDAYRNLSICDPYVDLNTLHIIFNNLKKNVEIRVLTAQVNDKPAGILSKQVNDINQEGFKVEIKIYKSSLLHDRYIIDDKHFWLSGNSLNYLGKKESFIVLLGEDIRQSMLAQFNSRWKGATPL